MVILPVAVATLCYPPFSTTMVFLGEINNRVVGDETKPEFSKIDGTLYTKGKQSCISMKRNGKNNGRARRSATISFTLSSWCFCIRTCCLISDLAAVMLDPEDAEVVRQSSITPESEALQLAKHPHLATRYNSKDKIKRPQNIILSKCLDQVQDSNTQHKK